MFSYYIYLICFKCVFVGHNNIILLGFRFIIYENKLLQRLTWKWFLYYIFNQIVLKHETNSWFLHKTLFIYSLLPKDFSINYVSNNNCVMFQDKCALNCTEKYLKMVQRISQRFQEFQMVTNENALAAAQKLGGAAR